MSACKPNLVHILEFRSQYFSALFLPSPDAVPVAVQPAGETTAAEMVYTVNRPGEEEGDPGCVDVSAGPPTTFLQLPPVERPENRLQKVATENTTAFHLVL